MPTHTTLSGLDNPRSATALRTAIATSVEARGDEELIVSGEMTDTPDTEICSARGKIIHDLPRVGFRVAWGLELGPCDLPAKPGQCLTMGCLRQGYDFGLASDWAVFAVSFTWACPSKTAPSETANMAAIMSPLTRADG